MIVVSTVDDTTDVRSTIKYRKLKAPEEEAVKTYNHNANDIPGNIG